MFMYAIISFYIIIMTAFWLEWPILWRITKNSLRSEGIYKWVNLAPIFFWYKLLPTTSGPQKFAKIRVVKVDYFDFPGEIFEQFVWIRCLGNCLQFLGFWNFLFFFRFFLPKLVYFWTKSRKKRYECFFHSICATDLNFGNKNIGRTKLSTLKTLIFENFWGPEVRGRPQTMLSR